MSKLTSGLNNAASVFTQQPGINGEPLQDGITEESHKRGPKKKGEFKKVTLNLDVDLNTALDKYILRLKQEALEQGLEAPNKSEWVRDLIEDKLRDLGGL